MAEAVTGRSYERLLRALVYQPLGLSETSLPNGAQLPRPFAHGYVLDPPRPPEDVSEATSMSSLWASGGMVSTPSELGQFMRGYVSGRLFGRGLRREQRDWVAGHSEPIGPGANSAGLGLFRYRLGLRNCLRAHRKLLRHYPFAAASSNGRRSVTVSVNVQYNQEQPAQAPFRALRRAFARAACAALAQD
jgi:D-alanyl-D-alanine carboxypeptidase